MAVAEDEIELLIGHKGGGKGGGGGGRVAQEDPNTLRSNATGRIIDIVSEGPIVGLVDGFRSMFLDDTPVQNEDGSFNFSGLRLAERFGYPDQEPFPRQPGIGRPRDVSSEVTEDGAIVRTVSDLDVDAVRIITQVPQLTYQDPKTGDLHGSKVTYAVDVRPAGGSWQTQLTDTIEGKTTAPYQRARRVDMVGEGPWDIRHRRITPDSDKSNLQNRTFWASYTELIDAKLIYPDTAGFGIEVDARQFGDSIPSRAYDLKGLIISVPSNYDPETREYSGLWDGTFKQAWTDNPAWCFYDLATNTRYGAGLRYVDKWELYEIGRYCDGMVDDGFGGQEPRFTFNTVIADQSDVYNALAQLASVFRGMTYWGTNTVMPVADMPSADAGHLATPANTIEGEGGCFEYAGASRTGQHSAWLVSYNDPDSGERLVPEIVEDEERIQRFGWKPSNITAVGCNSRGQARRVGLWARETERNEGETVTFTGNHEFAKTRPGDLVRVMDPQRAGARLGGRLKQTGTTTLTLDKRPDEATNGETWYLDVMLPTGGSERREVASFDGNTVTLAQPLSQAPVHAAIWVLASADVEPRPFRVIANRESGATEGKLRYQITGVEHDPTKYARVEQGIYLEPPPDSLIPTGPITPPAGIDVTSYTYIAGGAKHQGLSVSVEPSDDVRVQAYIIEARGPLDTGWRTLSNGPALSTEFLDAAAGEWQTRARAVDGLGRQSTWVYKTVNITGLLLPAPPTSVDLSVGSLTAQITPNGLTPGAQWEFWLANAALEENEIESNAVRKGVGPSIALIDLFPDTLYYLYIRGVNVYGESAWYPLQFTTDNNAEALLAALSEKIGESELVETLRERIDLIDGPDDLAGSVAQRLKAEAEARAAAIDSEAQQRGAALAQAYTDLQQYADSDSAAALQTQQLVTTFGGNAANALSFTVAQVDDDLSISTTFDSIDSEFQSVNGQLINKAGITYVDTAVADEAGARADAIQQAQSQSADDLAAVEQSLSTEIDNTTGRMEAMYAVRLQTDTDGTRYIGGFGLANDGQTVQAAFDVDLFSIGRLGTGEVQPFIVDTTDGNVYLQSAVIQDASITSAKITDLTADKIVSGTFATGAAPDPRLEMSLDGGYFWWAGQGAKTAANASAYVDENGNFVGRDIYARGDIEASSIKAGSANIIDTINLRGRAITNLVYYYASAQSNPAENVWTEFAAVNVDVPPGIGGKGYLEIRWAIEAQAQGGGDDDAGIEVRVLLDGSEPANGRVWEKWSYIGSGDGGQTSKQDNSETNVSFALTGLRFIDERVGYFAIPSSLGRASMQIRMNGNDARYYTFRKLIAKVFLR